MARNTKPRTSEDQAAAAAAKFKPDMAAAALVEAIFIGDIRAAHKFDVSSQSIRNWRARLETDAAFCGIFEVRRRDAYAHWKERLIPAILTHIEYGRMVVQSGDVSPETFEASNNALRVLLESQFSLELLNRAGNVQQVGADATANPEALAGG